MLVLAIHPAVQQCLCHSIFSRITTCTDQYYGVIWDSSLPIFIVEVSSNELFVFFYNCAFVCVLKSYSCLLYIWTWGGVHGIVLTSGFDLFFNVKNAFCICTVFGWMEEIFVLEYLNLELSLCLMNWLNGEIWCHGTHQFGAIFVWIIMTLSYLCSKICTEIVFYISVSINLDALAAPKNWE